MKKLKLEVEALTVESFTTASAGEPAGTVQGHAATQRCQSVAVCPQSWNCPFTQPVETCQVPCV